MPCTLWFGSFGCPAAVSKPFNSCCNAASLSVNDFDCDGCCFIRSISARISAARSCDGACVCDGACDGACRLAVCPPPKPALPPICGFAAATACAAATASTSPGLCEVGTVTDAVAPGLYRSNTGTNTSGFLDPNASTSARAVSRSARALSIDACT